jgi:hypothetical protein
MTTIGTRKVVGVGIILLVVIFILTIASCVSGDSEDKPVETTRPKSESKSKEVTMAAPIAVPASNPVYRELEAGVWSERINVMENALHVWPATAEVEYECEDVDGNIEIRPGKSKPGVHYWNDRTKYQRVRSKKESITYSVEKTK